MTNSSTDIDTDRDTDGGTDAGAETRSDGSVPNSNSPAGTDAPSRGGPFERKVQLPGGSTFAISLPKAWALEQDLEAGMSMYLYSHRDRLVVAPVPLDGGDRSTRIDAAAVDPQTIPQRVEAAYTAGCDRIRVANGDELDDAVRRTITRSIGTLVGVEIHGETEHEIVARNVLDAGDVSLPQTVAQIRQLALEMHEEALEAVRTDDDALARRVIDRDDDVDRLFAFVSRGFYRGLEDVHEINRLDADRTAAFCNYRKARQLERIADHAGEIASVADRQSDAPDEALADRLEAVAADAREVVSLALAGDVDRAIATESAVRDEVVTLDRTLYGSDDPDAYLYGSVLESIRRTAAYGVNVTDATVEAASRDSSSD